MNWEQDRSGESSGMDMEPDLELKQALGHFKASMDAWSYAALSQPRAAAKLAARPAAAGWRMAASWALGCLLVMGSLAGAAHEIYQRQEAARIAAQKAAQKAAEERAAAGRETAQPAGVQPVNLQPVELQPVGTQSGRKTPSATTRKAGSTSDSAEAQDANLLASVDSDVSRAVPAAMEPLAQLMDDDGTQ
jgi:hypothetical protein